MAEAPPRLTRQASLQRVSENKEGVSSGFGCCLLPVGIAAVVIASGYDASTSSCDANASSYTVDLKLFLNVAGYSIIGMTVLSCCGAMSKPFFKLTSSIGLLASMFWFAWSVIGIYMYDNQMSSECQDEPIAKMILSYSIIQIVFTALLAGCVFCLVCVLGGIAVASAVAGSQEQQRAAANEQDPLVSDA
eukprot:CAMPEP_0202704294 /NCGR_PEP_ID=MMETSP1385-20130828/16990_1 /ASSEMBLY_ACC=CAM_ASM_000861 /TAXON_ID=933848 /ORGANISM="Elphidium margaritaceum" /LENGTH=189 /DNA_ID=CAMNT_0049362277 /DNA_START=78 /DNA_END=647 /DNA_ORIENTATION=-